MKTLTMFLVTAALAGCDMGDNDDGDDVIPPPGDDGDEEPPPPPPTGAMQWSASITGNPGYESLIGDAVVTQMSGDTAFTATINLRGDTYLAVRPWHVHFGNCASGGGIVGDEASYSALSIGIDGTASSTARVVFALDPNAAYHVNVHLSQAQFSTLIACGDLVLRP